MPNDPITYDEIDEPITRSMKDLMDKHAAYFIEQAGHLNLDYKMRDKPPIPGCMVHLLLLIGHIASTINSQDEADEAYHQLGTFVREHYDRAVASALKMIAEDEAED